MCERGLQLHQRARLKIQSLTKMLENVLHVSRCDQTAKQLPRDCAHVVANATVIQRCTSEVVNVHRHLFICSGAEHCMVCSSVASRKKSQATLMIINVQQLQHKFLVMTTSTAFTHSLKPSCHININFNSKVSRICVSSTEAVACVH